MIRGIIFDCFGVLYLGASRSFYERHVKNYEQLRPELMRLGKAADYGLITQEDLNQAVVELTGLEASFVAKYIEGEQVYKRNDQLLEYAQRLRGPCKIGLLSNIGPGAIDDFFVKKEREQLFDVAVLSGEEGLTKPHPHIFALTAERMGLRPSECVMIDDVEENCAGADAAGMKAILYKSNAQTVREVDALIKENHA